MPSKEAYKTQNHYFNELCNKTEVLLPIVFDVLSNVLFSFEISDF